MRNIRSLKYSSLLLILILINGCETEVDNVKLPEFVQKLAIASFISPSDSGSFVFVKSNQRLYGELGNEEQTGNLTGTISDGSTEVTLDTVSNGLYVKRETFQVRSGKTYTLKIKSDRGLSAEGVSTVPEDREFYMQADSTSILHQDPYHSWMEFIINVSFTDFPGEINYFMLKGIYTTYKTNPGHETDTYDETLWFDKKYFTDSEADGDHKIRCSTLMNRSFTYYDSAFLKIYLLNTEKSYYLYHRSLENYNSGDNPFTEVTPVYSNIKGGFGIFTSYTIDSLVFRLK